MIEAIKPKVGVILASHMREPSGFSLKLLEDGLNKLPKKNIEVIFNGK